MGRRPPLSLPVWKMVQPEATLIVAVPERVMRPRLETPPTGPRSREDPRGEKGKSLSCLATQDTDEAFQQLAPQI